MFPNLDPKKMQAMMKQLGMNQEEIDASRVVIEKNDNSKIIIDNPSVTRIKIQGQESFQVVGDVSDEPAGVRGLFSEEDIQVVMEKTKCSEQEAREALEETGDLAEAIMKLS